jgi:ferric-dicitrate binding protein FerR (iron transport regulator)
MEQKEKAAGLLGKYLRRKTNVKEIEQVDSWYSAYEQKPDLLSSEKKKAIQREIYRNIDRHIQRSSTILSIKNRVLQPALAIAASLLIILTAALIFYKSQNINPETAAEHVVATGAKEKRRILLGDGTEVWLQPLSRFSYIGNLKSGKRTVELVKGEAFFKVFHDAARPFRVKMPENMYTHVLGTSFIVSAYPRASTIRVVVLNGKVAVGKENKIYGLLVNGQQISYNRGSQTSVITSAKYLPGGEIKFNHTPLLELARKLEWEYYVHIDIPSDIKTQQLQCTGTFDKRQSLTEILQTICMLHHLKLVSQPDQQTFKLVKQ